MYPTMLSVLRGLLFFFLDKALLKVFTDNTKTKCKDSTFMIQKIFLLYLKQPMHLYDCILI